MYSVTLLVFPPHWIPVLFLQKSFFKKKIIFFSVLQLLILFHHSLTHELFAIRFRERPTLRQATNSSRRKKPAPTPASLCTC